MSTTALRLLDSFKVPVCAAFRKSRLRPIKENRPDLRPGGCLPRALQ
jgi:hypothetical protein